MKVKDGRLSGTVLVLHGKDHARTSHGHEFDVVIEDGVILKNRLDGLLNRLDGLLSPKRQRVATDSTTVTRRTFLASRKRAAIYDRDLSMLDRARRSRGRVRITHFDGSLFLWTHALMVEDPYDKNFLWVFPEHSDRQVFAKEDLLRWGAWTRTR